MADAVAPEAVRYEAKHFAAGMVDRASVDREVLAMQNLKTLKDGEAVFKDQIAVPDENVKEPNFKELKDIAAEVDGTVNRATRESRRSLVLKKIEDLQNIITKETPITARQLQYVGAIAADIPAIIKSVAKDTGLTEAQVKADLRAANPSVTTILTELCDSKPFIEILSANVGGIEVSQEMIQRAGDIHAQELAIQREKNDVAAEKKLYTNPPPGPPGAEEWYGGLTPAQRLALENDSQLYESSKQALNNVSLGAFQRSGFSTVAEAARYQGSVDHELARLFGAGYNVARFTASPADFDTRINVMIPGNSQQDRIRKQEYIDKATLFSEAFDAAEKMKTVVANVNFASDQEKYGRHLEFSTKITELTGKENGISQKEATLATLKTQHGKDVATIAGKLEKVMERSFKDYYNKSMLTRGKQIAEYDANQKTELKQKEADLKAKQAEITKVLLDKYLRMSYLRYENGKEVGYDDKGLKKLVKEDLFNHSPADMARELLRRVYDNRGDFPDTFKKEIDALCKDMGVGAGPPRVTFNDVLKNLDKDVLVSYAATEMPKAFGYARARGYYFDRLRLKKHQVQYIVDTDGYGTDFFTQMLAEAKRTAELMETKEMKEGVLRSIDVAMKQLRDKTLGKDYQQGIINALKVAGVAAAATAGTAFIGGTYTLGKVAAAIGDVGLAASTGATLGIRGAADFVDTAAVNALGWAAKTGNFSPPSVTLPASVLGTNFGKGVVSNVVP